MEKISSPEEYITQREDLFRNELATVLNRYSRENGSDTPDFILAKYLTGCLAAWDKGVTEREKWYGRKSKLSGPAIEEPR